MPSPGENKRKPPAALLADADVLIDYVEGGISILSLAAEHIGPIYVLRPILDTVDRLSESECRKHGIEVIEAETDLLVQAGARSGALSFEDWLCLLTCQHEGWTCLTNDGALIRECGKAEVPVRRGLSLMVELVDRGTLDRARALRIAQTIQETNPHHINDRVLELFRNALKEA